jgi:hypothetical protein
MDHRVCVLVAYRLVLLLVELSNYEHKLARIGSRSNGQRSLPVSALGKLPFPSTVDHRYWRFDLHTSAWDFGTIA